MFEKNFRSEKRESYKAKGEKNYDTRRPPEKEMIFGIRAIIEAIDAGKKIIDITLPLGWDEKYGGILMFVDINGRPPLQLEWDMKKWWPQCEAMIALRLAYQLFGNEKYREKYEQLKTYCDKYFVDPKYGEWYGYLHYDNTVSISLKGNIFKGPFHIPRLYMIMAVMDEDGAIDRYAQ
mgnify:CR=1 FL=1